MTRRLSEQGVDHLIRWEGFRRKPYKDVAGHWTIGVGHLLTGEEVSSGRIEIGGEKVRWRDGLSVSQVRALLRQDIERMERAVDASVTQPLTQSQFDALVSLVYNIGPGAFARSSLVRRLNAGEYSAVPGEIRRWNRAGGRVVQGLVNRRESEAKLWSADDA